MQSVSTNKLSERVSFCYEPDARKNSDLSYAFNKFIQSDYYTNKLALRDLT